MVRHPFVPDDMFHLRGSLKHQVDEADRASQILRDSLNFSAADRFGITTSAYDLYVTDTQIHDKALASMSLVGQDVLNTILGKSSHMDATLQEAFSGHAAANGLFKNAVGRDLLTSLFPYSGELGAHQPAIMSESLFTGNERFLRNASRAGLPHAALEAFDSDRSALKSNFASSFGAYDLRSTEKLLSETWGPTFTRPDELLQGLGVDFGVSNELVKLFGELSPTNIGEAVRELAAATGVGAHEFHRQDLLNVSLSSEAEDINSTFRVALRSLADAQKADFIGPAPAAVFLATLLAEAKRVGKSRAATILLLLLAFLFKTIVEGEVQYYAGEVMKPVRAYVLRKLLPILGERVAPLVPPNLSSDLRLVSATNLQVRALPRRNDSKIIALVSTPTLVIEIRHQTGWALIEYSDGDATVRGWVYARYLHKVRLPSGAKP